jgi:hypothetical protein
MMAGVLPALDQEQQQWRREVHQLQALAPAQRARNLALGSR